VADYLALTKPRIVCLLVFTAASGYLAGAGGTIDVAALVSVTLGGALAAGGANAMNCALDRDLDGLMKRTRERPVAAGRIPPAGAVGFGLLLNAVAGAWLLRTSGPLAAGLALAGSAWYVLVYTMWLKRRSSQNIVIGGAAGCFPPLVGWAAATGGLDGTALVLAGVIFLWTPPHFWALATLLRDDYRRAGVPMLPAVASSAETARRILRYAVATLAVSLLPVAWHGLGLPYAVVAAAAGIELVRRAEAFRRSADRPAAASLFHYSLAYLPIVFVAAVLDRTIA
jgi:protoheme IX farnesyltransferase